MNNLAFTVNGRLRYVDGQCWLDAGKDGHVPLGIIGRNDVVRMGEESVQLDGQRVRVTVVFLDTVEP